jgi:hypothetical protein
MNLRLTSVTLALLATITLTFAADKPDFTEPGPDVIVKQLYKANDAGEGPFHDRENPKLLKQYFTKELAMLIRKDAVQPAGEVSAYDFDPLYESQDPQTKNFKIGQVQRSGVSKSIGKGPDDRLRIVPVTFTDYGKRRFIRFLCEQQADKSWKIADVIYSDGNTLTRMIRDSYK